jgi:hypothetical protein
VFCGILCVIVVCFVCLVFLCCEGGECEERCAIACVQRVGCQGELDVESGGRGWEEI